MVIMKVILMTMTTTTKYSKKEKCFRKLDCRFSFNLPRDRFWAKANKKSFLIEIFVY